MDTGHFVLSVAALIALGTIGLLLELHKQDKVYIAQLENKLTPWNKGKSGYKQPRKAKPYSDAVVEESTR